MNMDHLGHTISVEAVAEGDGENVDEATTPSPPDALTTYLARWHPDTSTISNLRQSPLKSLKCCKKCQGMLEHTMLMALPYSERRNICKKGCVPNTQYVSAVKLEALKKDADQCGICAILLSVLRSQDDLVLRQSELYENPNFNTIDMYNDDGVSDVEGYIQRRNVQTILSVRLKQQRQPDILHRQQLRVELETRIRTGRIRAARESAGSSLTEGLDMFLLHSNGYCSSGWCHADWDHKVKKRDACSQNLGPDARMDPVAKSNWIKDHVNMARKDPRTCSSNTLPARILDLQNHSMIRLIDFTCQTEGSTIPERYVALSHRWGSSQHLKLTHDTEEMLRSGCAIEDLPATFRDAAFYARFLGFRYLWIDALCIIQNSPEDWKSESFKMGDIFSGADVVFAVHCAYDDSEGFLHRSLSKRGAIVESILGTKVGLCRPLNPEFDITNSNLSRRGWVLQERLLAKNTIHFTHEHIYYETLYGIFCEDDTVSRHASFGYFNRGLRKSAHEVLAYLKNARSGSEPGGFPQLRQYLTLSSSDSPAHAEVISEKGKLQALEQWPKLIETYSHCELTKNSDKLMAISGIARKIHIATGSVWCAGLWDRDISRQLLWFPTDSGLVDYEASRAPSWSWAAWDGKIQYRAGGPFVSRGQFISLSPSTGDEVPWLHGPGRLTIRGRLVPVSLTSGRWWDATQVTQIGPGPLRKRDIANDPANDLPRVELNSYLHIRILTASHLKYKPIGWLSVNDMQDSLSHPQYPPSWPEHPLSQPDQSRRRKKAKLSGVDDEQDTYFLILETSFVNSAADEKSNWLISQQGVCLGLFLQRDRKASSRIFHRLGAGQMSWNYVSELLEECWKAGESMDPYFSEDKLTTIILE